MPAGTGQKGIAALDAVDKIILDQKIQRPIDGDRCDALAGACGHDVDQVIRAQRPARFHQHFQHQRALAGEARAAPRAQGSRLTQPVRQRQGVAGIMCVVGVAVVTHVTAAIAQLRVPCENRNASFRSIMSKPARQSPASTKRINLALQGGGAHGAFTWGVLDLILEDGRLDVEAISGASAGAMNAIAFADGMADSGREGARRQLERFWRKASIDGGLPDAARRAVDGFLSAWGLGSSAGNWWFDTFTRAASPYDFNPLNINPLKAILDEEINFERVRTASPVKLFISATNVETGKIRIFKGAELTADHIAASACLPLVFQAVEIDGAPYWDGGYMGNPALYPLFESACCDILLVQINPVERKGIPRNPAEIQNRLNEITFNATLLRELRAIDFVARLIDEGTLTNPKYKRILMHRLAMSDTFADTATTKLSADWSHFLKLKEAGRKAARSWLNAHYDALGQHETMDLHKEFG